MQQEGFCYCPISSIIYWGAENTSHSVWAAFQVPETTGDQSSVGWCHRQTLLTAPFPQLLGVHQGASMEQGMCWHPERNFNSTGETSVLGYSPPTRHKHCSTHPEPAQHVATAELGSASTGAARRERDQKALGQQWVILWVSRTEGPVETCLLCWEQGAQVAGKRRAGLASRMQHFQGFLPSSVPRSEQPKSICSEGVESHQHKQEAPSKKASSVLLRRCNHVRNTKRHRHLQKSRRCLCQPHARPQPSAPGTQLPPGPGTSRLSPRVAGHGALGTPEPCPEPPQPPAQRSQGEQGAPSPSAAPPRDQALPQGRVPSPEPSLRFQSRGGAGLQPRGGVLWVPAASGEHRSCGLLLPASSCCSSGEQARHRAVPPCAQVAQGKADLLPGAACSPALTVSQAGCRQHVGTWGLRDESDP